MTNIFVLSKIICKFCRFERGTFTFPGVTNMCPGDNDDEGGAQICALGSHFCAPGSPFCAPGGLVRFSVSISSSNSSGSLDKMINKKSHKKDK